MYKFLRGGLVLALGWARPGGLWISLCLHIGSWCCSERLDCARTPPWEPSWGRNGPHGPEPLDFIVLALGCSKNRPAQGGGAGLLIYSQNRWPRTPITYKKKHCRCSVFCTYTKHYRWPRTPITYTTTYMCVNERQDNGSGAVKMQGEEVTKVEDFKYLGSTVQSDGECGREVKKRVQAGWNGWRRMS